MVVAAAYDMSDEGGGGAAMTNAGAVYVYVRSGFSAGDRINISPLDIPVEGTQVVVQSKVNTQ